MKGKKWYFLPAESDYYLITSLVFGKSIEFQVKSQNSKKGGKKYDLSHSVDGEQSAIVITCCESLDQAKSFIESFIKEYREKFKAELKFLKKLEWEKESIGDGSFIESAEVEFMGGKTVFEIGFDDDYNNFYCLKMNCMSCAMDGEEPESLGDFDSIDLAKEAAQDYFDDEMFKLFS